MKKKLLLVMALVIAVLVAFAACAREPEETPDDDDDELGGFIELPEVPGDDEEGGLLVIGDEEDAVFIHPALLPAMARFPAYTTNPNPILQRGDPGNILQVGTGVGPDGGLGIGLWLGTHLGESVDASINSLAGTYGFVSMNTSNMWSNDGIATFYLDRAANAIELNMQHNVYWHDGTPLTLDDLVFAYYLIGHPDYSGPRFDSASRVPDVVGMTAWREGDADHISGLVLSNNNRTLRIYHETPYPPGALFAGSFWSSPAPRHWLEPAIAEVGWGVELEGHPRAREEILGFGPFIIESTVTGESVFMVANENYWRGAPAVDGVHVSIVPMDMVLTAMVAGEFDVIAFAAAQMPDFELAAPTNFQLFGWPAGSETVFNFTLGYRYTPFLGYDEDGEREYGPWEMRPRTDGHPITNVDIRRALAHAIDRPLMAEVVGNGLWVEATSILHPFNAGPFMNPDLPGFPFDLARANQILDDAGFTERCEDGFRLNLDGSPMHFYYAQHHNLLHERLVPTNLQNWRYELGLNVELYTGDHMAWGLFLDTVVWDNDLIPVDIFAMGWSMGINPEPHGLWADNAIFNMSRYTSPALSQALYDIRSERAWDPEFLADAYARFEQAFYEEVPALPFTWNLDLLALNNRVTNVSRVRTNDPNRPGNWGTSTFGDHLVALTAPAPFTN